MSYPELYSDERVVLKAQNVKVKSVLFEVVLTTRRLVLIDTKKNSIPPQEINLATLKDVESGENAIRDPTITISIITISGNTRQMVLTFSKTSGGERRRECDEWVRALRQNIITTVYHPVTQPPAPRDTTAATASQPPVPQPPAPAPHRIEITNVPPPKKRIEIARPMKKIVEAAPAMPVPVETTSLPVGSFCNRCGNRIPPDSAFCNRCGTPVAQDTGSGSMIPETDQVPQKQPAPVPPQVQVTPSPLFPTITEKKDRPIEQVIHSIEPLIEDSVPRAAPAPLVPARQGPHVPPADTAMPSGPVPHAAPAETAPEAAAGPAEVQWPVLPKSGIAEITLPPEVPVSPEAPEAQPPAAPPHKRPVWMAVALILVVLAIIAGAYVVLQGQGGIPGATPTPAVTVPATTIPPATVAAVTTTLQPATTVPTTVQQQVTTPSLPVPASGVWVKVTSSGKYSGTVGTPGRLREIDDEGSNFYQIPTTDGPVAVSIRKSEGTATVLAIDVYKDGDLFRHAETTAPRGLLEFQASLKDETTTATASP